MLNYTVATTNYSTWGRSEQHDICRLSRDRFRCSIDTVITRMGNMPRGYKSLPEPAVPSGFDRLATTRCGSRTDSGSDITRANTDR